MKPIRLLGYLMLILLLSLVFTQYIFADSFFSSESFVFDPNFINDDSWSYSTYRANTSSYVQWQNTEKFFLHVIDDTSDDKFGWGYLHQGTQPHGWGAEEQTPLKKEFWIRKSVECKPNTWFSTVKLKRTNLVWFDVGESSIPQWLKDKGMKAHFDIGLMFSFETTNINYYGVNSKTLQFEVQFVRLEWNGTHEFTLYDEMFYEGFEDPDVHNIFAPNGQLEKYISPSTQMVANKTYEYTFDCGALLNVCWDRWFAFFPVSECRLRYVGFYVETINCGCDCDIWYSDVYSQPTYTSVYTQAVICTIVIICAVGYVAYKTFS